MKTAKLKIGSKAAKWFYRAEVQWPDTTAEKAKHFGQAWLDRFCERAARIVFRADILAEVTKMHKAKAEPAAIVEYIEDQWAAYDWPNREPAERGGTRVKTATINAKMGQSVKLTPELIEQLKAQGINLVLNG